MPCVCLHAGWGKYDRGRGQVLDTPGIFDLCHCFKISKFDTPGIDTPGIFYLYHCFCSKLLPYKTPKTSLSSSLWSLTLYNISGGQGWKWEDWLFRVQQIVGGHQGGGRGWIIIKSFGDFLFWLFNKPRSSKYLWCHFFWCQFFWQFCFLTTRSIDAFSKKEEQEIREEFLKLDTDQSGFITKGESFLLHNLLLYLISVKKCGLSILNMGKSWFPYSPGQDIFWHSI